MKIKIDRERVVQTVKDAKARAARRGGAASNWTRPEEGNNIFRLFAFLRGDTGEGAFVRELRVHQPPSGKPVVCGKSPARTGERAKECALCDDAARIKEERGREAANRYFARPRYAFVAVPLRLGGKVVAGEDRRPRVWQASKTVGEKILAAIVDEDIVDDPSDFFGCTGLDVKVKYDPDAKGAAMYEVSILDSRKAKTLDASLQEKAQGMDLFADLSLEPEWFQPDDDDTPSGGDDDSYDETPGAEPGDDVSEDGYDEDEQDGYDEDEQAVYDETVAKLAADGMGDLYEVEVCDNEDGDPAPVFYKVADIEAQGDDAPGSWDYPEKPKPKRKTRSDKGKRRKPPTKPQDESDGDITEGRDVPEEKVEAAKAGFKPRTGEKKRRPPPGPSDRTGNGPADDATEGE